jgi:proton-dependent oligopeptide transporter, POT family
MCSPIVLWYGRDKYHRSPPTGSVLATAIRLWRFAARGEFSWNPVHTYKRLTADDFWDKAKPSNLSKTERPKWMTFDDKWVDEVKRALKACSVFCWYPIYCEMSNFSFFHNLDSYSLDDRAGLQPVD